MDRVPQSKDPAVLSYLTLRKVVGFIAVLLPFALAIAWLLVGHAVAASISGYYYTGMRNVFVGSLCAISMFMLCCRGYDRRDEIAGAFSGVCALGVAFFPTAPEDAADAHQVVIGHIHYAFAAMLFATLAYFCLRLFRLSAANKEVTREKRQRNRVYTVCGCAIITSMGMILLFREVFPGQKHLVGVLSPTFIFETTALIAFGYAWLVKGETFFKDDPKSAPNPAASRQQLSGR